MSASEQKPWNSSSSTQPAWRPRQTIFPVLKRVQRKAATSEESGKTVLKSDAHTVGDQQFLARLLQPGPSIAEKSPLLSKVDLSPQSAEPSKIQEPTDDGLPGLSSSKPMPDPSKHASPKQTQSSGSRALTAKTSQRTTIEKSRQARSFEDDRLVEVAKRQAAGLEANLRQDEATIHQTRRTETAATRASRSTRAGLSSTSRVSRPASEVKSGPSNSSRTKSPMRVTPKLPSTSKLSTKTPIPGKTHAPLRAKPAKPPAKRVPFSTKHATMATRSPVKKEPEGEPRIGSGASGSTGSEDSADVYRPKTRSGGSNTTALPGSLTPPPVSAADSEAEHMSPIDLSSIRMTSPPLETAKANFAEWHRKVHYFPKGKEDIGGPIELGFEHPNPPEKESRESRARRDAQEQLLIDFHRSVDPKAPLSSLTQYFPKGLEDVGSPIEFGFGQANSPGEQTEASRARIARRHAQEQLLLDFHHDVGRKTPLSCLTHSHRGRKLHVSFEDAPALLEGPKSPKSAEVTDAEEGWVLVENSTAVVKVVEPSVISRRSGGPTSIMEFVTGSEDSMRRGSSTTVKDFLTGSEDSTRVEISLQPSKTNSDDVDKQAISSEQKDKEADQQGDVIVRLVDRLRRSAMNHIPDYNRSTIPRSKKEHAQFNPSAPEFKPLSSAFMPPPSIALWPQVSQIQATGASIMNYDNPVLSHGLQNLPGPIFAPSEAQGVMHDRGYHTLPNRSSKGLDALKRDLAAGGNSQSMPFKAPMTRNGTTYYEKNGRPTMVPKHNGSWRSGLRKQPFADQPYVDQPWMRTPLVPIRRTTATHKKDSSEEHGVEAMRLDDYVAKMKLDEFTSRFPMTGRKAQVVDMKQKFAAEIQHRLELVLYKKKEKEALLRMPLAEM